ncbi:unnamed protein product [Closterium sp. NIES-54]
MEAKPLLLFFIAFTVLGAIGGLGDRGRFVDDRAPVGPPVKPGSFKAALGLSEDGPLFGFTKANELFVGRDGANGRAKEIESKKCNLGGTSKLSEHEESGAAAQKQHKAKENTCKN